MQQSERCNLRTYENKRIHKKVELVCSVKSVVYEHNYQCKELLKRVFLPSSAKGNIYPKATKSPPLTAQKMKQQIFITLASSLVVQAVSYMVTLTISGDAGGQLQE